MDLGTLHDEFDSVLPGELDDAACKRALAILLDVGTALALECKTPGPDASLADRSKAYERVALAVRRTILLVQHLKTDDGSPENRRVRSRKQIIRAVEDTIERKADPAEADDLRAELVERLDSPDFADDLAHRPPADLIHELCRDLGLAATIAGRHQHCRRTPDDIAILCAQAAAGPPPSPLPPAGEGWVRLAPQTRISPPRAPPRP